MNLPFKMIIENDIEQMRADTFYTKEPETLAWQESFKDGEAFFDVGANIGLYSLFCASLHPNSQIYAFEPMPKNFIRLMQNVELNGFTNIHCFNVAMDRKTDLNTIYIPCDEAGQTGAQIEMAVDENGTAFAAEAEYLIQHWTFDDFTVQGFDTSTSGDGIKKEKNYHIKIDVDGHEKEIIQGMEWEIINKNPKSILIEFNNETTHTNYSKVLIEKGYGRDNEFNHHPNHSRIRRAKEGIKAENVIFTRA